MDKPLFSILYKLADGKRIRLEVTGEVMELLEQSDRQIRSQGRQDRRHITNEEYSDGLDDSAAVSTQDDPADLVIQTDSCNELYTAIARLPETQRRRVRLYYFRHFTCRQIADMEKASVSSVARSLVRAVENLKRILAP